MKKEVKIIISNNKKAYHDYFIEEVFEVGIVLSGTEVKSVKQGKVSIKESYCIIRNSEAIIINMNITPYDHGNIYNLEPNRDRKLLLNKKEINKLIGKVKQDGYSIIPLNLHISKGWIKLDIGVAKGKKNYDKRADIIEKEQKLKIQHALKNKLK